MMRNQTILAAVTGRYIEDPEFRRQLFESLGKAAQHAHFNDEYVNEDDPSKSADAIGIWIAQSTGWIGERICDVACGAFEDANYHSVVAALPGMI